MASLERQEHSQCLNLASISLPLEPKTWYSADRVVTERSTSEEADHWLSTNNINCRQTSPPIDSMTKHNLAAVEKRLPHINNITMGRLLGPSVSPACFSFFPHRPIRSQSPEKSIIFPIYIEYPSLFLQAWKQGLRETNQRGMKNKGGDKVPQPYFGYIHSRYTSLYRNSLYGGGGQIKCDN